MNKHQANDLHVKRRGMERFGVRISDDWIAKTVRDIQAGRAKFIRRYSMSVKLFLVKLSDGSDAIVAYDRNQKNLRTIMKPKEVKTRTSE